MSFPPHDLAGWGTLAAMLVGAGVAAAIAVLLVAGLFLVSSRFAPWSWWTDDIEPMRLRTAVIAAVMFLTGSAVVVCAGIWAQSFSDAGRLVAAAVAVLIAGVFIALLIRFSGRLGR